MPLPRDPNLAPLEQVVCHLGSLCDELMLVGGCATSLLITDPGAAPVRPTMDVDLVVEALTYVEYEEFGKRLVKAGFQRSVNPGDPLCRWHRNDLRLDVMPLDEKWLGFSNRWYRSAVSSKMSAILPRGGRVYHIDAPHFLATKLEAFASRGAGDYAVSHDLEDLVRVVDGRESLITECARAPNSVLQHVIRGVTGCLADRLFVEALPEYFSASERSTRARIALERLRQVSELNAYDSDQSKHDF